MPPLFGFNLTDMTKASERTKNVIDEHTRGEQVEKELTAFIEKRDKQRRKTEGERR
jgi:hypothetical protein